MLFSQDDEKHISLHIQKATDSITIDGKIKESSWTNADVAKDFIVTRPNDGNNASNPTKAMLTYDDEYLYIAAVCYDEEAANEEKFVVQNRKRDFSFPRTDAFAIFIDPDCNQSNGLSFAVSPCNTQRDGSILNGGFNGVSTAWSTYWESEVTHYNDRWELEMKIPFSILRFDQLSSKWNINFARNDFKHNEVSTWSPVPRSINVAMLGHTRQLIWDNPPTASKKKVIVIPYITTGLSQDLENGEEKAQFTYNAGADARIALNPSIALTLTANPDFSQVEVDQQVVNLDRFELRFPERRLLFLEDNDLFGGLGNSRVRPFFTRRIGGVGGDPVGILGGVKLSGTINKNWRLGVMDIQTKYKEGVDNGQNYMIASLSRYFRPNPLTVYTLNAFTTSRKAFGEKLKPVKGDYNVVSGLNLHYQNTSKLKGDAYMHYATTDEKLQEGIAYGAKMRYKVKKGSAFVGMDIIGENYITDMGFVPRLYHTDTLENTHRIGYAQTRLNGYYRIYSKKKKKKNWSVDYNGPTFRFDLFSDNINFDYQEHDMGLGWELMLKNRTLFNIEFEESSPRVFFDFYLPGITEAIAPGNYKQNIFRLSMVSSEQDDLQGSLELTYGDKFLGKQTILEGEIRYRPSVWGTFAVNVSQNQLSDFLGESDKVYITLIGSRAELSLNKDMFFTTFLQYNTQLSNFNVNCRLQWRFHELSEAFLVFTNNSSTDPLQQKNWSAVFKVNYWF